ncbi:MAG: hypothetical protein ACI4D3_07095 [Lachnospiraceae bacterium]
MSKRIRQYLGLITAVLAYYLIHEGAHLIYALSIGVFRQINFLGVGVQVDVYAQQMSNLQMGVFCLVGAVATTIAAYMLILAAPQICKSSSKVFKACMYYITLIMLLLDPLYLSVLCGFFGGGDMNGIALLLPEVAARILFGVLLLVHGLVFWKVILPKYKRAFSENEVQ